jgi:hypothetical protein
MKCPKCGINSLVVKDDLCVFCGYRLNLTMINNPPHYAHSSGVECIELSEAMDFNSGNAFKYIWRFREKNGFEDLHKALWYVRREIGLRGEEDDGGDRASSLARVVAYETNPTVALLFWYLAAGDHMRGEKGVTMFREAERLIEGLIHDAESATR